MTDFLYIHVTTQRLPVECGGWTREAIRRRGLAMAVTWTKVDGFRTYRELDIQQLIADLAKADCVVGYTINAFAYRVIEGHMPFAKPRTLDLMAVVEQSMGSKLSFDAITEGTLGQSPSNRVDSTAYWQEGNHAAAERACHHDVDLIRRLHEHMIRNGRAAYVDGIGDRQEFEVAAAMIAVSTR